MNTKIKIFMLVLIFAVSFSAIAEDPPSLTELQKSVADFSEGLAKTLPFNSSLGLNWADAYIGKFLPSSPPHFGVGGSFGVTTMDTPAMKTLASFLGGKLPLNIDKLPLPAYTVEVRVGGVFLPFDAGFKFGYLPSTEIFGIGTNYLLVGGDIRYALLDKPVLPKISVGVGFNYLQGGISAKMGSDTTFAYGGPSITLKSPKTEFNWATKSLDFKAQISKSFLIITPYLGLGVSYAWSEAGYSVKASIEDEYNELIGPSEIAAINDYLRSQGVDTIDVDKNGASSIINSSSFNLRAFGGISLNIVVFKIDLTVLYSILDNNYGGSVGLRFQL
ncbi:MAG: hypothetical protein LBB72_09695 [Spirochaetaceae bacterium]|jgi:hypothetical protein|nr:hypothetical protein [Spirochaetaceae bacterium]